MNAEATPRLLRVIERGLAENSICVSSSGEIPDSELVVVEGAGHVPHVSHPRACLDAIAHFLDGVDA